MVQLKQELVSGLRVDETYLHVLESFIAMNQSVVIHVRVMENVTYYDEESTYSDFNVVSWWRPGQCNAENTTDSSGYTLIWTTAQPYEEQSHNIPETLTIATRRCIFNNSKPMQDVQWMTVQFYTVIWQPCNDSTSTTEIFVSGVSETYMGRGAYVNMVLVAMAKMKVNQIKITKVYVLLDAFFAMYYSSDAYAFTNIIPMKLFEYLIDQNIMPILEGMLVKLKFTPGVDWFLLNKGQHNAIVATKLQKTTNIVGVESIHNETCKDQLEIKSSSESNIASPGTDIKVTPSDPLLGTNTRFAVTLFVDYITSDSKHVHLGLFEYVLQVLLHNEEETSIASDDYIDVWVNNTLDVPYTKRTVASYDFDSDSWTTRHCDELRSTRSGLDVFRCSHLGHNGGITREYFHIYFHNATMSDYLARNMIFAFMMIIDCIFSLIGLLSIYITAIFCNVWREDTGHKVLLHMVTALAVNLLLGFVNNVVSIDTSSTWCVPLGVIRHYTFLAMFCWMLVLSCLQIKRLTTIAGAKDTTHLILKISCIAWGLPLIPVITLLALKGSYTSTDNDAGSCYPGGTAFKATVLGPVGFILAVNFVIYIIVVNHIFEFIRCGKGPPIKRHVVSDRTLQLRRLSQSFFIFFLFGFTWFFHFLSESKVIYSEFLYEYLFLMTATTHVFILSIIFVFLDKKVRKFWKRAA